MGTIFSGPRPGPIDPGAEARREEQEKAKAAARANIERNINKEIAERSARRRGLRGRQALLAPDGTRLGFPTSGTVKT